jgi:uncharacterized protein (DUF1501 family)
MSAHIPHPRRPESPAGEAGCCTEDEGRRGLTRRGVLAAMGVTAGAVAASPLLSGVSFAATPAYTGDVLVVLSMHGGWDTLSVVPPVGDPDYAKLRPTLGIPSSLALPAGGIFGLHPALAALKPYFDAGQLGVVHAAGNPAGVRSHFKDEAELEKAAPGTGLATGWLERVLETRPAGTAFQATELGGTMTPGALIGPAPSLALNTVADFSLNVWSGYQPGFSNALSSLYGGGLTHPSAAPAAVTMGALTAVQTMITAGYSPANNAVYPTSPLGNALKDLARMIKANVGLQIACLDYGNWDMHTDLGRPGDTNGWMHKQLLDVAACLAAFAKDLGSAFDKVNVVTLSEFGRRAKENGGGGFDHGLGQAVLAFGGGIKGGSVIGNWPTLAAGALNDGDLAVTTDYRSILSEILTKRCGLTAGATVFPGFTPSPVGITK